MIDLIYRPIAYLSIKLSDGSSQKFDLDIKIPFYIALGISIILIILNYFDNSINIFGKENNLLSPIISFYQAMPGFYIAALAAIATFPSASMNKAMPEPTPYLLIDSKLEDKSTNRDYLSRRRFLCYMFAYLAFISIIFFFIAIIFNYAYSFSLLNLSELLFIAGYFTSCLIVSFIVLQTIFITFLGLWYLGHRIHLNDNCDED
ncbi:hypothetical protein [Acinetobacter pittii]|uniref:hypothetical protein n=1 Tax=Acinetobacter pittii TaxID=48296 RepID=UPI00197DD091|nr:hypothetical protein [Acinetobacter pittii]MBN6513501.1 hypothetical protein [Acinetobacter pittii]